MTEVAVKISAARLADHQQDSEVKAALPARALTEALVARNLAHPNLMRT